MYIYIYRLGSAQEPHKSTTANKLFFLKILKDLNCSCLPGVISPTMQSSHLKCVSDRDSPPVSRRVRQ